MMKYHGFTLVELMVVVFIFTLIFIVIFSVSGIARRSWDTGTTLIELQQETRKGMGRMIKELRQSGVSTIIGVPPDSNPYNAIIFQIPDDVDGDGDVIDGSGNIEWGNQIRYSLGGPNNEQLQRTSGGSSTILANKVASLQFRRFSAPRDNIVEISLQAQKDTVGGRTMQSNLHSQVSLRN